MHLFFLKVQFSDQIVQAIYRTLIHSIWQGLLFAIIAAIVIRHTQRSKPALRYNWLTSLFLLFVITSTVTFFLQFKSASSSGITSSTYNLSSLHPLSFRGFKTSLS